MPRTDAAGTVGRVVALAAVVAWIVLGGPSAASAQTSPGVDRQAWARTGPAAPLAVQESNVYVAAAAGQEQARTFLHVDTAGADDVALTNASITLAEAPDGFMAAEATLAACAVVGDLRASGELSGQAPATDCSIRTPIERGDDGTWTVPLAVFAEPLAAGTVQGVALVPEITSATSTFTVSLDTAKTRLDGVVAPAPTSAPVPAREPVPAPAAETAPSPSVVVDAPVIELPGSVALPAGENPAVLPERPTRAAPESPVPSPRREPSRAAFPIDVERAASPPAAVILVPVLLAAALLFARSRWLPPVLLPAAAVPRRTVVRSAWWGAGIAVALLFSEATTYKLGFIAIVFVGAIGLHILVNWGGELSLAHAGFIGLPAFAVAQVSSHAGVSPILTIPIGIAVGALLGLVVAVAAMRARGLQVALATLAVAIAIERFFFIRTWVIGPSGGLDIPLPSLFGIRFETSRSLVPVLVVIVAVAVLACGAILNSKVGRALSLVRANPDAAAAAGIPVAFYRSAAYGIAGAFAGLAGSAYVLWVQRVGPRAFPLDLGFTYLVIAVLAGRGGLGGLAMSAVLLEGGRLFSILPEDVSLYLGPVALIFNVTRYQEGFNGVLRETREQLAKRKGAAPMTTETVTTDAPTVRRTPALRLPVVVAGLMIVAGFSAMGLSWYHAGNTDQLWIQNQEIVSGGLGGLGLIVVGCALLLRDALLYGRATVGGGGQP